MGSASRRRLERRPPERFGDVWGAKTAVVLAAIATIAMIVLCAPGVVVKDALLAHHVEVDAEGWRTTYAEAVCSTDDRPDCSPEQIGTIHAVHAIQLVVVVTIAALGAAARRRGLPVLTHVIDLIVLVASLGGTLLAVRWAWTHLDATDALIASAVIPLAGGFALERRWRDRDAKGPVAIIAFFVIKGAVIAAGMTPAIVDLKLSVRESFPSSSFAGPVFMVIGGFSLAIPIAFSLLAFHPTSREEGRDWEHLRRA